MNDSTRTRAIAIEDEALTAGHVFTIQLSLLEQFVDERPCTLLRNETRGPRRKLFVRDETNGVVRAFTKPFPLPEVEYTETHLARGKRAVLVERCDDRVVMHEPARERMCALCGEEDVFAVPMQGGPYCADCVCSARVAELVQSGADVDFMRALLRFALATTESAMKREALARLDGLAPWSFFSEKFAQPEWGFEDSLRARTVLIERMWRGLLDEQGAAVEVFATGAPKTHPWLIDRARMRFTVRGNTITAHNGDVVAVRA